MQENEPDEQFEATDYDEDGNIKLPPPPLTAAKQKRVTVADLAKRFDVLEKDIDEGIASWLGELDSRLNHLEVKMNDIPTTFAHDIIARLDNQDAATGTLADALRSHLADVAVMKSKPEPEPEFAQPQSAVAGETDDISDMAVVACVCQTMTDVLTVTRALKIVPELTDAERNEILHIACRASGVVITPGLQIRAGVKFTGA